MNNTKISNVKYYKTKSKDSRLFEAIVQYTYQNKPVKYFIFIKRKPGLTDKDYLKEAEKIFNQDLKSGKVNKYNKRIYPATISRPLSIAIISTLALGALALGGVLIYKAVNKEDGDFITFDAEGGTLELYDTDLVRVPYFKNETWSQFYPDNNYVGATKDGYDFLTWSVDGKNPIPCDYKFTEPTTLKPLYVKNPGDRITISCRYFDSAYPDGVTVQPWIYDVSLVYSFNGGAFEPYGWETELPILKAGEYFSFKTTSDFESTTTFTAFLDDNNRTRFAVSGPIDALTNKKDFPEGAFNECFVQLGGALCSARGLTLCNHPMTSGCFGFMFYECNNLLYAPELPATTLADGCYTSMFEDCTSLIQAPSVIPAEEILAGSCFSLFDNCRNLSKVPDLSHIKKIHEYGCASMFQDCASLTSAANFDPEIVGSFACQDMFSRCVSLTKAPKALSANKRYDEYGEIEDGLPEGCYSNMFRDCRSLTTAPEIKATNIFESPFVDMFAGCSKLNSIKIHYVGDFGENFMNWVSGVADEGTFYYNGNDVTHSESAIPVGWTVSPF